jgi:hypothetical protein
MARLSGHCAVKKSPTTLFGRSSQLLVECEKSAAKRFGSVSTEIGLADARVNEVQNDVGP